MPLPDDLLKAAAYPHPVTDPVELIETHISWVFLAGDHAYKVKKPVNLGFLDFSTLEKRAHFCDEELRINRRTAADIYLDVLPITDSEAGLCIDGAGNTVEYAIRMRRFPQSALLSTHMASHDIGKGEMRELGHLAGYFHRDAEIAAPHAGYGTATRVAKPIIENFQQIRGILSDPALLAMLAPIEQWSMAGCEAHAGVIQQRLDSGYVRECHGDLHPGNILFLDGRIIPFDAIEFDPGLRWIDIINDIAFTFGELYCLGDQPFAWSVLNAWLEITGDYAGLELLMFYSVYRAMVRTKVAAIGFSQSGETEVPDAIPAYLQCAQRLTRHQRPRLIIMHGLSGSGKSYLSERLAAGAGTIRIRSDVERKRIFGLDIHESSDSGRDSGIYTPGAHERTLEQIIQCADNALGAGFTVILDATFLERSWRDAAHALAERRDCRFDILSITTDEGAFKQRIQHRASLADASEAGVEILMQQIDRYQPPGEDEQPFITTVADSDCDIDELSRQLGL